MYNAPGGRGNYLGAGGMQNPQMVAGAGGQFTEDFYTYETSLASLAAAATATSNFTIQADSDFDWIMTTVSANIDGVTEPAPDNIIIPITVIITDQGSGRQLMSAGVPLTSYAGNGKQPFILPIPRRFMAKSTVTLVFNNYGGSKYDNIFFSMIGRKIFNLG